MNQVHPFFNRSCPLRDNCSDWTMLREMGLPFFEQLDRMMCLKAKEMETMMI